LHDIIRQWLLASLCTSSEDRASRFSKIDRSLKIAERGWDKSGYGILTDEEYEAIMVGEEGKHRLMLTRGRGEIRYTAERWIKRACIFSFQIMKAVAGTKPTHEQE
jgi:hypothetical protein